MTPTCTHCPASFDTFQEADAHWNAMHRRVGELGRCEDCGLDRDQVLPMARLATSAGANLDRLLKDAMGTRNCAPCRDAISAAVRQEAAA